MAGKSGNVAKSWGAERQTGPMRPLVAVIGPTGSGKSELALMLASRFGGEVVNCDSLQVYRGLDIGTAKLSPEGRSGVPHHLIDIAEPGEVFTAGEYARRGRAMLGEIAGRGRLPVLAGGTGFYLRALLEGLFAGPRRDPLLRGRLELREAGRPGVLFRLLRRLDPAAAARIHRNDVQKLVRAVEVCLTARRPITELFAGGSQRLEGFRTLKLGLDPPRQALYERLNARAEAMFAGGLIEEAQGFLARGYTGTEKAFESLGYRQAFAHLRGEISREEAIELTRRDTRRYAKRQLTWFRREPGVVWLEGFGFEPAIEAATIDRVAAFLEEGSQDLP